MVDSELIFDLRPVTLEGEAYIKITSDEMLKVIVMGVQRVLKSRKTSRHKWATSVHDPTKQRRKSTKPIPDVILPSLVHPTPPAVPVPVVPPPAPQTGPRLPLPGIP